MSPPLRTAFLRIGLLVTGSLLTSGSLAPAFANGIRVADNPALPPFTTLQAAIDAAPDGGLLLVQSGIYGAASIDGKSLSIVEMPGAIARTTATLTIQNLGSAQRVLVSGIEIRGAHGPGVSLTNDAGTVRFQGCTITGGYLGSSLDANGAPGMSVQTCPQVVLSSCVVIGGRGINDAGAPGRPGGHGLDTLDSNVAAYDCTLRGGEGGHTAAPGGNGGDGCRLSGWGLFASGCFILGGDAGDGDFIGCNMGGTGGDGLELINAQAQLLNNVILGGAGGTSSCPPNGPAGLTIHNNGGVVNLLSGTRRKLEAAALSSDSALLTLTVTGQPGDRFCLARSWSTGFAWQAAFSGVWTIPPPGLVITRPLGTIPASGTLAVQVRTPNVVGLEHRLEILQGYCVDTANVRFLTGPIHVEHFDAAGGPDCDTNGANDFVQLIGGAPDCNRNVTLDACDISSGTSLDQNQNGIPDECPGG